MTETEARSPAFTDKGAVVPVYDCGWTPIWTLRNYIDDLFDDFLQAGGRSPPSASRCGPGGTIADSGPDA